MRITVYWYGPSGRGLSALASRLICRLTHRPESHVGIQIGAAYFEAVQPRIRVLAQQPDGAIAQWSAITSPDRARAALAFLTEHETGRGYSLSTIAADLLNAVFGTHLVCAATDEWDCSGLVAKTLQILGLLDLALEPRDQTPGSLHDLLAEAA